MILHLPRQPGRNPAAPAGRSRSPRVPSEPYPAPPFAITIHRLLSDSVVIRVAGDVDMLTAPLLDAEIAAQLRSGAHVLILDLVEVTFLGGSAVRALLAAREAADQSNTSLSLVYSSAAVSRPLSVLGLTDLFHTTTYLFHHLAREEPALTDPQPPRW